MINQKQRVIGSYQDEKEAKRVIRHLLAQGFQNKQLTIYTNKEKHPFDSEGEHIQVTQPDTEKNEKSDKPLEEKNFWASIRDAFHIRKDHEFDHSNYRPENDLLAPYREDLRNGFYIVTIEGSKKQSLNGKEPKESVSAEDESVITDEGLKQTQKNKD